MMIDVVGGMGRVNITSLSVTFTFEELLLKNETMLERVKPWDTGGKRCWSRPRTVYLAVGKQVKYFYWNISFVSYVNFIVVNL